MTPDNTSATLPPFTTSFLSALQRCFDWRELTKSCSAALRPCGLENRDSFAHVGIYPAPFTLDEQIVDF